MDILGWILAGIAGVFSTGLVIGVVLTSRRSINVTQTNSVAQHNSNSGGGGKVGSGAGSTVVPVVALGTVAAVVVMALTNSAQQTAQVSAVAGQSIAAQTEIVQAMPQPVAPISVPVAQPTQSPQTMSLADIAALMGIIGNVVIWPIAGVLYWKRRRQQARGIQHPAFNKANVKERVK